LEPVLNGAMFQRMPSRCLIVLGALSFIACAPPLTGLYSLTLNEGELSLFPDETNGCPARPEVTATQDGVALKQTSPGGLKALLGVLVSECTKTTWAALPIAPTDASTTFVLKDTLGHVVTAEFAAVMGPRGLTLISPATPSARQGDSVVLEWSPSTDILDAPLLPQTDRTSVYVNFEEDPTTSTMVAVGTLAGHRVSFTLSDPLSLPNQTTTGALELVSFGQQSGVLRCEGVPHCVSPLQVPTPTLPFTVVR
jgi:hypothetical protein